MRIIFYKKRKETYIWTLNNGSGRWVFQPGRLWLTGLLKTNIASSVISNTCVWPMISLGSLHLFRLQRKILPPSPSPSWMLYINRCSQTCATCNPCGPPLLPLDLPRKNIKPVLLDGGADNILKDLDHPKKKKKLHWCLDLCKDVFAQIFARENQLGNQNIFGFKLTTWVDNLSETLSANKDF